MKNKKKETMLASNLKRVHSSLSGNLLRAVEFSRLREEGESKLGLMPEVKFCNRNGFSSDWSNGCRT